MTSPMIDPRGLAGGSRASPSPRHCAPAAAATAAPAAAPAAPAAASGAKPIPYRPLPPPQAAYAMAIPPRDAAGRAR